MSFLEEAPLVLVTMMSFAPLYSTVMPPRAFETKDARESGEVDGSMPYHKHDITMKFDLIRRTRGERERTTASLDL